MQQQLYADGTKSRTSRSSRSSSVGSDAVPTPVVTNLRVVPAAKPSPAYVAAAAASELVNNNHQLVMQEDAYDLTSPPSPDHHDNALFSSGALAMINAFLDQLLYNFLIHSRGTTLAALRQAVEQVLKGKLAGYAIASADEELEELLNDDDLDETLAAVQESASGDIKGDVEAIFWRTRLRVMVYMRLGELEDEDEEQYVEEAQDILHKDTTRKRLSLNTGLVSWAAAIFLTSIVEFIAEQCLNVAGQAAFDRAAVKRAKMNRLSEDEERITVEEYDTEKIALSSTLGRLWRTWRKSLRSPHSRNISMSNSLSSSRKPSASAIRAELLGLPRTAGHSRNVSEKAPENGNTSRSTNSVGNVAQTRGQPGSLSSDEGARVNAVRIYRISQRPRSLLIEPAKRVDSKRISRDMSGLRDQGRGTARRARSRSLPNPSRTVLTEPELVAIPNSARPGTATKMGPEPAFLSQLQTNSEKTQSGTDENVPSDDGGSDMVHRVDSAESGGFDNEEGPATEVGQTDPNFLDRAVATRKAESDEPVTKYATPHTAEASVGSTESFTSIEEEDMEAESDDAEHAPAASKGLGIHSSPATDDLLAQTANNTQIPPRSQSRTPMGNATRTSTRSLPYQEPQVVRPTQSFDREDKSSLRRLSNSSSKHSKSNSSARHQFSSKPSQETLNSPHSPATSRSGYFERGFGDLVAGEGTVKYTLTPRTLQEIESPDSPRYKAKEINGIKDQKRKHHLSDEDLAMAQKAVIASMNASLKTYPSPNSSRAGTGTVSPASVTSPPSPVPPIPALPKSFVTENEQTQQLQQSVHSGQSQAEVGPSYGDYTPRSTGPSLSQVSTNNNVPSPPRQAKAPQANPSSGWFSSRTSMESSKAIATAGTAPVKQNQAPLTRKKSNPLLQPREAVVGRRGENDELVAFLRSTGPPGSQPFRGPNGYHSDYSTVSPTTRTSSSITQSAHGSTNSHSGLLQTNGSRSVSAPMQGDPSGPKRTRRRVKDPYALPSDDEDEDGLTALPTSRSETLVEFLRNVEPPSASPVSGTSSATQSDLYLKDGSGPASPNSPSFPQSKTAKGKGNVKAFWKRIGA